MRFSIVIPTFERQQSLHECLSSILLQSRLPDEVIIVDDGTLSEVFITDERERFKQSKCTLSYYRKDHVQVSRGTSISRNIGMSLAREEVVFILDDDLFLEKNFLDEIMSVWEREDCTSIIGIGGVILNNRKKSLLELFFNHVFVLESTYSWDVTDVGYQTWNDGIQKCVRGFYEHGGACSYRKTFVMKLGGFTVLNDGRTALEDVEFALRAKRSGLGYFIEPRARTEHNHALGGRTSKWRSAFQESQNRKWIFQTMCKQDVLHQLWFVWSSTGWILRQFLSGQFQKGFGMIIGFFVRNV